MFYLSNKTWNVIDFNLKRKLIFYRFRYINPKVKYCSKQTWFWLFITFTVWRAAFAISGKQAASVDVNLSKGMRLWKAAPSNPEKRSLITGSSNSDSGSSFFLSSSFLMSSFLESLLALLTEPPPGLNFFSLCWIFGFSVTSDKLSSSAFLTFSSESFNSSWN